MRRRAAIDLRPGGGPDDGAGPDPRVPALIVVGGLIIGWAALAAPAAARVPAEAVAGLLAPGALYFLSFLRMSEVPVRLGASIIAVIASWTGAGTAGYSIYHGIYGGRPPSDVLAMLMLSVVYLLGLGTFVVMRSARLEEPGVSAPAQDEIEHPSDH